MNIIEESAEHHFLTFLDKIKADPAGWVGLHYAFSRKLSHTDLVKNPQDISRIMEDLRKEARQSLQDIKTYLEGAYKGGLAYIFSDCDVVFLGRPQDEAERREISLMHKDIAINVGDKYSSASDLSRDIYSYQKIADARLLGAARMEAYRAMVDTHRVQSLPIRRQRRDSTMIMIVEDDRFTAAYAAGILNKDYETIPARSGEEAIKLFIEHAPDVVFLDIHLPGLNGHETLQAIRQIDPRAFVVMLSVDTARENVVDATHEGASGFLKKPFSRERILHVVRQSPFAKRDTVSLVR